MIIGNKADREDKEVWAEQEDFKGTLPTKKKLMNFEVSAKENEQVHDSFIEFCKSLMQAKE